MIRVEGLRKSFGRQPVLRDLDPDDLLAGYLGVSHPEGFDPRLFQSALGVCDCDDPGCHWRRGSCIVC